MRENFFDKVSEWSIWAFIAAAVGLIASLFFRLMLFAIPMKWGFWYGLCKFLYVIGTWAFRIGTPLFIVLAIVAFVGDLIYRITHK